MCQPSICRRFNERLTELNLQAKGETGKFEPYFVNVYIMFVNM